MKMCWNILGATHGASSSLPFFYFYVCILYIYSQEKKLLCSCLQPVVFLKYISSNRKVKFSLRTKIDFDEIVKKKLTGFLHYLQLHIYFVLCEHQFFFSILFSSSHKCCRLLTPLTPLAVSGGCSSFSPYQVYVCVERQTPKLMILRGW